MIGNDSSLLEVRIAGRTDDSAIAHLRAMWTGVDCDAAFEQRLARWLSAEGDRRTTWLAWAGEQAIGMASLLEYRRMPRPGRPDSRWGYLGNMFVRAEFRNRGVGSALLATVIAAAEERAYARVVLSPSEAAISFYRRAGFIEPGGSRGGDRLLVRTTPHPHAPRPGFSA